MLKCVIFDMDGVLVDSHPIHRRAWRRCLSSTGMIVSEQDMEIIFEGRKREEILRFFLGELSDDQIRAYGGKKEALFHEESGAMGMIPGVREFLDEIAGAHIPMAVASSGSRSRVNHLLDRFDLRKFFRFVVTGDDVAKGKPAPAIFLKAAAGLDVAEKDALVVEDSVSGVQAAKAAGMKCLGVAPQARERALLDAGVDFFLPDFRNISIRDFAVHSS
jgi:beta-phosphoglucomutase